MTQFDRNMLGRQAKEFGFIRDTFEKVCRLADILSFLENDTFLSEALALKGGTAINLTIFDLPRLSVDIDLDFTLNLPREEMIEQRRVITENIGKYMKASGYTLSIKSKTYHALDSYVYEYSNSGGMKDNLKIEINYMLRSHALSLSKRTVNLPWLESKLTVLSVAPIEIFASKIVALLNRTAPRDLYDVHNLMKYDLFGESEKPTLRKCVMLYSAIGSESVPKEFNLDRITQLSQYQIRTNLLPVLRRGEYFDVKTAQTESVEYLSALLHPTERELLFWETFRNGEYNPEFLFDEENILARIKEHPMALWKCGGKSNQAK
jgi:predicted nucleotidyltransferase component of viral defense system